MEQSSAESSPNTSSARELNHRVRNMLQIVMGLCNQTLRQSEDLRQFENLFLGRVQALARVYEVLQRGGWAHVSVRELIEGIVSRILSPTHFRLEGDHAYLSADAATGFGLVVHEITEGARQRGVGGPAGGLHVRWEVTPETEDASTTILTVHWRERLPMGKDHAVHSAAIDRLQRQLRHELNASVLFENAPGAYYIKLVLPLELAQARH